MAKSLIQSGEQVTATTRYDTRELAKLLEVSPRQLQRNFNRYLKRSPKNWLNAQRIMASRRLLLSGGTVKEVAFELGFKQVSHFCRQFKMFHQMTPSQFVQRNLRRPVAD